MRFSIRELLLVIALLCVFLGLNSYERTLAWHDIEDATGFTSAMLKYSEENVAESDIRYRGWPLPIFVEYDSGFVRRGFFGDLVSDLQPGEHHWLMVGILGNALAFIYAVAFVLLLNHFVRTKRNSPADTTSPQTHSTTPDPPFPK